MWQYDTKNNVLNICKVPYKEVITDYRPSEMYNSYMKYVHETVKDDIINYLMPLINEATKEGVEQFAVREPVVTVKRHVYYRGRAWWEVYLKFKYGAGRLSKDMQPFVVFRIPDMDEMGILYKDGRSIALLAELTQDNEVTFEKKSNNDSELKLMTDESYFCLKKENTSIPKFVVAGRKLALENVVIALAVKEGIDTKTILSKVRVDDFITVAENDEELKSRIEYAIYAKPLTEFMEIMESEKLLLGTTRDYMNRILTFDRAIEKVLARDITKEDGSIIATRGTIITEGIIKRARKAKVDTLYVEYIPNKVGQYLGRTVIMSGIRKGTRMIDRFKEVLPEVDGMYADKDYIFKQPLVLAEGMEITDGLLEALAFNKYTSVYLKETKGSSKVSRVYFEKEVLNNRQYRGYEIGKPNDSNWYYKQDDGSFKLDEGKLTAWDVAALTSLFYQLIEGKDLEYVSNRDLGLRKKVKLANEIFHERFKKAVVKSYRVFRTRLYNLYNTPGGMNNPEDMAEVFSILFKDWWRELMDSRLVQSVDTTNPLALHSSLNKIVSIVKDSNAISDSMRTMSMGHYGRICPYEVPQSKKLGVVNAKAAGCTIVDGVMKTAYNRVYAVNGEYYIADEEVWLSVEEEENERIADLNSLDIQIVNGRRKIVSKNRVLARVPSGGLEKVAVEYISPEYITMVNVDPNQMLGFVAQAIPFVGADDSTRVSFETSMTKQAKLVLDADVPIVMTSAFVDVPRLNTYYQINAEDDGTVLDVDNESITIKYDSLEQPKTYQFRAVDFTLDSVTIRHVTVEVGDRVCKGDILMESNATKDGYMAIGKNLLVAFNSEGYNYEDGVHAAERSKYSLTSYGSHITEMDYPQKVRNIVTSDLDYTKYMRNNNSSGILLRLKSEGRDRVHHLKHKHLKGFLIKAGSEEKAGSDGENRVFKVQSVTFDYLNSGDKMANRHGNKGVTPKLRQNDEMLMFPNGEFIDISYNPTGVTSRMNIGQILEAHLGFAAYILGIRVRTDSFNGATDEDVRRLLKYAYDLANSDGDVEIVLQNYKDFPSELHEHVKTNIQFIRNWKGCFNEDGTAYMYDPKIDRYIGPMVVGVNYVYKLIHESAKKVHVRAGYLSADSNYSRMADAPTKGAANAGGQRVGTMEVDALSAYGATAYIHEMMNERGDNAVARSNFTVDAVHDGDAYKVPEKYAVRRSTEYLMQVLSSLGLEVVFDKEEGIPNLTKEDNEGRRVCRPKSILMAEDTFDLSTGYTSFDEDYEDMLRTLYE